MSEKPDNENSEPTRVAEYATKKGEVVLRPHEYDGIQEYDQKLPNWWLMTFYGAIATYLIYWFVYYQTGLIRTDQQRVTSAMTEIQEKRKEELENTLSKLSDKILVTEWANDPNVVAEGKKIYSTVCFSCHGENLDAPTNLGLSMVDHEWKYGDRPLDIFNLINDGTPPESTGMAPTGARMIPWGAQYQPLQIAQIVAYIISEVPEDFEKFKTE